MAKAKEKQRKQIKKLRRFEKKRRLKDCFGRFFYIAHANALNLMKIEEDQDFLLAQRQKGRPSKIGSLDKRFVKKAAESIKKKGSFEKMNKREEVYKKLLFEQTSIPSDTFEEESSLSDNETCSSQEEAASCSHRNPSPKKRGRINILDNNVTASLDAAKLADRKTAIVLTTTLKSLSYDPTDNNVNRSSIRRLRMKTRASRAQDLRKEFSASIPLTFHWGGKTLEDISGFETVDRLPIIVSGKGIDQLLAVPKLQSGTGEALASAANETLELWGITKQIKCMRFDTTPVNTGLSRGSCAFLEHKILL